MPENIRNPKISVIIPAYNESLNIGNVISATVEALEKIGLPYEIIVVDDGSADMTAEIARDRGARVIQNKRNFGKGHALRSGFRAAEGDIIVTIDADSTSNPQEIEKLVLPLMKGADIVFGTRFSEKSNVRPYATSRILRLGNKLFNLSILLMTGRSITDSQTSFRAFDRKALNSLNLTSNGFEVEVEITVKALNSGFSFEEVPITSFPTRSYHASKINVFRDGFRILRQIFRSSFKMEGSQK